jgi:phosphatidate cytidylyltransferase
VPGPADPRRARWADLRLRILSALVLAPVALACLWAGAAAWAALVALAALGVAWEWAQLCGADPKRLPGLVVPALAVLAVILTALGWPGFAFGLLAIGFLAAWAGSGRPGLSAGILYLGISGLVLVWLRADAEAGLANVLFIILVVWASDIGAYLVGRWIGGPKLAPSISPGKTWSGAVGGLASAVAIGLCVALLAPGGPGRAALVAAVLAVVSQAGDLLESAIKRRFGVKDSGRLIPGHGGLLDRLDAALAAIPLAALLAKLLGPGVVL